LASHREFAAKHSLPFLLVADTDGRLASRYGVGSTLGFTHRITFVIGPDGRIVATFDDVDPDSHAPEVLAAVEKAAASATAP
jgi:peroxiredoxin Q/BCP